MKLMRLLAPAAAALALLVVPSGRAAANCNLIPAAPTEFRSTLGTISRTIAPPGEVVVVRVDLACNPTARGFDPTAANNQVTLHFVPPGSDANPALATDVAVTGATVENCSLGAGRCDTLRFTVPDTDAQLAPPGDGHGLTGPAEVLVRAADSTLIADIGPLFDPTLSCGDQTLDGVFDYFTVLPTPNSFGALAAGTTTTALATIDGGGNLLLPIDYTAVLPGGAGAPQFRLLQAGADLDAFSSSPGLPIRIPNATFVRSFNTAGRPIPPVLDVNQSGDLIQGTADAAFSVLRIARIDPFNGGPPLYDLSDRLEQHRGPIVIENMQAQALQSAPLDTLSADPNGIAFARSEAFENVDLDSDEDKFDRVAQVVDIASGASTSCGEALTEVNVPPFVKPALATGSGLAAFAESEARQGHQDLDGNGDVFGNLLRVFTVKGQQLTGDTSTPLDPQPVLDGKPIEISNGFVFFRTREGDGAPRTTELLSPSLLSPAPGTSQAPSLDTDGRIAAFESDSGASFLAGAPPPAAGFQIYVIDRQAGLYELVSRNAAGTAANAPALNPSISGDGRYVAYESAATNLGCPGGPENVFVYDRQTHTVQCASAGLLGAAADGPSSLPAFSQNGRFVAFNSTATNLVSGDTDGQADYFVFDRQLGTTSLVTGHCCAPGFLQYAAAPGERPAISSDGRFVAGLMGLFAGSAPFSPFQIAVLDRLKNPNDPTAGILTGDQQGTSPAISGDGRFVAWSTPSPLSLDDTNSGYDVYVLDTVATLQNLRLVVDRVSVDTEGRQTGGSGIGGVAISADGRFVAFDSNSGGFVPGSGDIRAVYRYDRSASTIEQSSVSATGQFGENDAASAAISGDGRVVAFVSRAENLAPGPYGPEPAPNVFAHGYAAVPSLNAADTDDLDTVLQVFDPTTQALRPAARVPANSVAVAAGRAAILGSEADDGGINRNPASGDHDANDVVARFYDANTDTFRDLGVAADRIAISDQVVCLTDPEAQENNTDLDGDGDQVDDVVAAWNIALAPPLPTNVGVPATAIGATGSFCVFTTPDRILHYYDVSNTAQPPSAQVKSTGLPARDFVAKGDLVAFRVCEFDQGPSSDLNGDDDAFDCVMHVLRLSTGQVTNTHMAASLCDLPGCDPFFEPYRVLGNTVSFLTREADQSGPGPDLGANCTSTGTPGACDLNHDGDNDDLLITVFNVDSSQSQLVLLGEHDVRIAQDQPPFPVEMGGRIVLPIKVPESQVGVDLNGDGKIDDTPVVLVVGDVDKDGALDSALNRNDTCVEVPNPSQTDADGDGLGDENAAGANGCDANPHSILPGSHVCDVDNNGVIDRNDVSIVFGDRGTTARASDPRDADHDGKITALDVSLCSRMCKNPSCAPDPPPAPHCGLLGIEPALLAGLLYWRRRGAGLGRGENGR